MNEAERINALLSQSNLVTAAEAAERRRKAQETRSLLRQRQQGDFADAVGLAAAKEVLNPKSRFGNTTEGRMLEIALDPSIPMDDPTKIAAMEYLERDKTTVTPDGTIVTPGYSFDENGKLVRSKSEKIEKPPSETERRGGYTVGMMRQLHTDGDDYIPGSFESLASDYIPAAFEGFLTSSEFKKYKRNADEWARSQTLLKSGVTARAEEVEAAFRNYWPQPGDGPTEVKDKRLARERAMNEAEAAYVRRTNPETVTQTPSLEELLEIYK